MPSLPAALIAFLIPGVVVTTVILSLGGTLDWSIEAPAFLFVGAWYAAPFVIIRLHREWAPGRGVAVLTGLGVIAAAYGLFILDAAVAEPGRGANIGGGLLMLVLPIPLYFLMLALSFIEWNKRAA